MRCSDMWRVASSASLGVSVRFRWPNDTEFSGERKRVRCNELVGVPAAALLWIA